MEILPDHRYEIEIDSLCSVVPTTAVGKPHQIPKGKSKVVVSGAELETLKNYVEEEIAAFDEYSARFKKQWAKKMAECAAAEKTNAYFDYDALSRFGIYERPVVRFRSDFGRERKPFRSLNVIKELGPVVNHDGAMRQNQELIEAIKLLASEKTKTK